MIFFVDLDDTLLDFPKAERENLRRTLAALGYACSDALFSRFHAINDGLWKQLERGEIARERLKVRRFELLFEEMGISADAAAASRAYFKGFEDICCPFEGAREFLHTLKTHGRVYIVTNGSPSIQYRHLEDAGFLPEIAGTFVSEEIGANKPSQAYADFVRGAVEGLENEPAVWIGDSLTSDMVCAERLGVPFVLFAPHGPADFDGPTAHTYAALLTLLGLSPS